MSMTDHTITLTNLNVRQSIAMLVIRLIIASIICACISIIFLGLLIQAGQYAYSFLSQEWMIFFLIFGAIEIFNIVISTYIVLQWLNEYYEISSDYILHKKGIFFRKTEKYKLDLVREMEVHDSILGEIFNFATVTLYDIRLNKYLDLYLIHNPRRYVNVIRALRPDIEIKEDMIRLPFSKEKNNGS